MKSLLFLLGLVPLFLLNSCTEDFDDNLSLLGTWIEESPVEGRTELHFQTGNSVIRITGDGTRNEYSYRVSGNTVVLSLVDTENGGETELFFQQLDQWTLMIEDLYPSIPENPTTFMIFKRRVQ